MQKAFDKKKSLPVHPCRKPMAFACEVSRCRNGIPAKPPFSKGGLEGLSVSAQRQRRARAIPPIPSCISADSANRSGLEGLSISAQRARTIPPIPSRISADSANRSGLEGLSGLGFLRPVYFALKYSCNGTPEKSQRSRILFSKNRR